MITVQYLGHSCFMLTTPQASILFDPFISGNPLEDAQKIDVNALKPDFILISHGHADHILDVPKIAMQAQSVCVGSWEIHEWLQKLGIQHTHPMNTGGFWNFPFGRVQAVVAQHSSGLPDGSYGGNPMGYVLNLGEKTVYYAGDTALTMDMQLIPMRHSVDVAFLPIGSNFTMDIDDALVAANWVKAKKVIAMHFDTFGFIEINKGECLLKAQAAGIDLVFLEIGQSMTI